MSEQSHHRLAFLLETVALEAEHLQGTDERMFAQPFTPERAASLRADAATAERLDAFAARFARLQDTLGDKLLPAVLADAVNAAHQSIPMLAQFAQACRVYAEERGLALSGDKSA